MANIKSDRFWTRVSCNTNRCTESDGLRWNRQYSNLEASKAKGQSLLAICDMDLNYHKRLTDWEKERIISNREDAIERQAKKCRID